MADRLEIIDALESLAVHCRPPLMDIDAKSRWMQTWCEDLKGFDIEPIRAGCREWRQGSVAKFPTPGQLLPLIRAAAAPKQQPGASANNQVWTWPSDELLASMTLAERRRNYLIMASETRAKAGPMDDQGNIPRPEFVEESRRYADEAKRLGDVIKSQRHAAE